MKWMRVCVGVLAVVSAQIGVWAQFAPRSFYDSFPGFGRVWVGVDGPFNEHLVRDVGGLNLALAVVLAAAVLTASRQLLLWSSLAFLAYDVPHLVYHFAHRDIVSGVDAALSVGGLVALAGLAAFVVAQCLRGDDRER